MKNVMKKFAVMASASAMAAASVVSVDAATVTDTFTAQIIIQADCEIISATDLDFGTAGVLTSNVDSTSTITVQCTDTTPYTIGLSGAGSMTDGSNNITYAMYSDAGRTSVWGAASVAGTGDGTDQAYTVFGRVPIQTSQPAATYTDTVTVTVTY